MPKPIKKYKYMLVLERVDDEYRCNVTLVLDHPITEKDLNSSLKNANGTEEDEDWIIINVIPLEVTGHFDYAFLIVTKKWGVDTISRCNMLFDHQITTQTMNDDYEKFKSLYEKDKNNPLLVGILFHQEIP